MIGGDFERYDSGVHSAHEADFLGTNVEPGGLEHSVLRSGLAGNTMAL